MGSGVSAHNTGGKLHGRAGLLLPHPQVSGARGPCEMGSYCIGPFGPSSLIFEGEYMNHEAQYLSSAVANIPGFQHREKMGTLCRAPFLASAKSEEKQSVRKHASIVSGEK